MATLAALVLVAMLMIRLLQRVEHLGSAIESQQSDVATMPVKTGSGETVMFTLGRRPGESPSVWGARVAAEAVAFKSSLQGIR